MLRARQKRCPQCHMRYPEAGTYCFVDGATLEEQRSPHQGRLIATRYRLDEELYADDTAPVFRAADLTTGGACVLKLVLLGHRSEERLARIHAKAARAAALRHAHVERIDAHGEEEHLVWLQAREPVGRRLDEVVSCGPMPPARAMLVGRQIAEALAHAHENHCVHGHLSPGAVFAREEPGGDAVTVTDFHEPVFADPLSNCFTPRLEPYVAPEAVLPTPETRAGDLYALGAMLFQLLAGRPAPGFSDPWEAPASRPGGRERAATSRPPSAALFPTCLRTSTISCRPCCSPTPSTA